MFYAAHSKLLGCNQVFQRDPLEQMLTEYIIASLQFCCCRHSPSINNNISQYILWAFRDWIFNCEMRVAGSNPAELLLVYVSRVLLTNNNYAGPDPA